MDSRIDDMDALLLPQPPVGADANDEHHEHNTAQGEAAHENDEDHVDLLVAVRLRVRVQGQPAVVAAHALSIVPTLAVTVAICGRIAAHRTVGAIVLLLTLTTCGANNKREALP